MYLELVHSAAAVAVAAVSHVPIIDRLPNKMLHEVKSD